MNLLKIFSIIFPLIFLSTYSSYAQSSKYLSVIDTFKVNLDNSYSLSKISVIPFSESIYINNKNLSKADYKISYSLSSFSFSSDLDYSINDTIIIKYQTFFLSLQKEYKRRNLVQQESTDPSKNKIYVSELSKPLTTESIFGRDIQKSGTIVRGFTLGTTRDLTINSGLRLQLNGKLAEDIEIVAALSDENLPIQPEGNTERLDELEKVFIEIRHPNAIGTFGDFDLSNRTGEFGRIDRKLQGLKGLFLFGDYSADISIASSKGKYNTNNFLGDDGVQGPYRLYGSNNERDIIIIAGSERVYIDGREMKRGENNDYTIDYSNSEINFTTNRLITSTSRIVIDFEYTDRRFQRNYFQTGASGKILSDKITFKVNYFREGDDENNPIDFSFSDEEKDILLNSGDDRNKAVKSGISIAEPDSLGIVKGTYSKVDTLINEIEFTYYIYDPGGETSIYNINFSFVGEAKGDYVKASLGNYRFVGIGQGNYLPIVFLPLPELKQMANLFFEAKLTDKLSMKVDLAGSSFDKNLFSNYNDNDNEGYAGNLILNLKPAEMKLFDIYMGSIGLNYKERYIQKQFSSLDRINTIEFDRDYNSTASLSSGDESLREATMSYIASDKFNINLNYGSLKRGGNFSSNRFFGTSTFKTDSLSISYKGDYVKTSNALLKSSWFKQEAGISYLFGLFSIGGDYFYEKKEDKTHADSLISGSLILSEIIPKIGFQNLFGFTLSFLYSIREESSPISNKFVKEAIAKTQSVNLNYRGIKEISSNFSFSIRNKEFTDDFKQLGRLNNETILLRNQSRFNFWNRTVSGDFYYDASTQRAARREKVFVKVLSGQGNYIYLGDLNNNGIADENEFEPTTFDGDFIQATLPTDELFPVIDLKVNTRWTFSFKEIANGKGILDKLARPISTETSFRVEENSRETETKQIYLLNFSKFLNDSTTIRGSNIFQQDFFIFKNENDLSFRFRYVQRNNLNSFTSGIERGYYRERSLRINLKLVEDISNQTEIIFMNDNAIAPKISNRSRTISNNSVMTDFSYRPLNNIEVGFKLSVGEIKDFFPETPSFLDNNSQSLRVNYALLNTGRLRVEFERNEFIVKSSSNIFPFEITRGNSIGKNYYLRINFDYRIGGNLQISMNYDGRKLGSGNIIHTAQAEARAYF